jgi:glycerol-3-phosphate dehydrogenase
VRRDPVSLADRLWDLLIIGGGCTGAGVALDAAMRGMSVALLDKGDFASATSSASSKLVHGGLRYLEHGQMGLVYEALAERRRLLRNAPHLVRPLRFILPFYRDSRMPRWKGRVGLWLYDLLAGSHNLRRSRDLSALRLRRAFPALRSRDLLSGVEYFDAQMDDARLCLEIVRTASLHGATAANYVELIGFETTSQSINRIQARDALTGETIAISARQILNATGPWVDALRQLAGENSAARQLQPTKGVHVIIAGAPYAEGGEPHCRHTAFTLLHPEDGRVFFVLPWQGRTLLGTTDTFCDMQADALTVTALEEQYLLDGYNHFFRPPLGRIDIRGRFAGLRPLLRSAANDPSARSREFRIIEGPGGLLSVAGGKWTTYRHMAEAITDRIAERLGVRNRCRTANLRLDGTPAEGWESFVATEIAQLSAAGFDQELAAHLVNRYGRRASEVAAIIHDRGEIQPVVVGEPDVTGEWEYQRRQEMAMTPADHLLRRSRLGMWHPELLARWTGMPSPPGSGGKPEQGLGGALKFGGDA